MDNDSSSKAIGISTMKVKMSNHAMRISIDVKHVSKLRKSLISLKDLNTLGYDFFTKDNIININWGILVRENYP